MAFDLYFSGAEEPGWRRTLIEEGVEHIALTFMHLRKRLPKTKPFLLDEKVPDGVKVFLDSGAFTANSDPGRMDHDAWLEYGEAYLEFVKANLSRLTMVTEFDALALGDDYVAKNRWEFWDSIPLHQFLPVWHPQSGEKELNRLAEKYDRVAIPGVALDQNPRLGARINHLAQKYGVDFHGSALTKPDLLKSIRFSSASSTSWLSPIKYGDTIVWTGTQLKRYPRDYKDRARKQHKGLIARAGFDPELILADDATEVVRFSIWSWRQFEASMNRGRGARGADEVEEGSVSSYESDSASSPDLGSDTNGVGKREPHKRNEPVQRAERLVLPVIGIESVLVGPGGEATTQSLMRVQGASQRACDNCYINDLCPQFEPGHACAFDIPVEIRTKDQLMAVLSGLLEMQTQRVLFARLNEELQGGFPDPATGVEMDRLFGLTKILRDINDERDFISVTVRAQAASGVITRVFGDLRRQGPEASALPEGGLDKAETDALLARAMHLHRDQQDVVDAEVVEDS